MPGSGYNAELRSDYRAKKQTIERRLAEFRAVYDRGDEAIFEELCLERRKADVVWKEQPGYAAHAYQKQVKPGKPTAFDNFTQR